MENPKACEAKLKPVTRSLAEVTYRGPSKDGRDYIIVWKSLVFKDVYLEIHYRTAPVNPKGIPPNIAPEEPLLMPSSYWISYDGGKHYADGFVDFKGLEYCGDMAYFAWHDGIGKYILMPGGEDHA